jgi:methylthioribulose-1-phosphate dehydratase
VPAGAGPDPGAGIPETAREVILRAGQWMDAQGWVPATAGNLSVRLAGPRLAITRSGVHKGRMDASSVIEVDLEGRAIDPDCRPSAETGLHCQIYATFAGIGAVLHGHSVANTVLSLPAMTTLRLSGYELLKALGLPSHESTLDLPVFDNDQDIPRLCRAVAPALRPDLPGYLIRGHGIYAWGRDMAQAMDRLEALEFLLRCELTRTGRSPT